MATLGGKWALRWRLGPATMASMNGYQCWFCERGIEVEDAHAVMISVENMAPLHPKAMPVILPEADYRNWLTGDWEETQALACPYPSQLMGVESPASA